PGGAAPGTNGIFYYTDASGNSVHHALTLQAMERAGKYFRLNASYTFAKTLDDGKFLVFVDTPQSNDQRSLERAVSNQNVRHRFIANFVVTRSEERRVGKECRCRGWRYYVRKERQRNV